MALSELFSRYDTVGMVSIAEGWRVSGVRHDAGVDGHGNSWGGHDNFPAE